MTMASTKVTPKKFVGGFSSCCRVCSSVNNLGDREREKSLGNKVEQEVERKYAHQTVREIPNSGGRQGL